VAVRSDFVLFWRHLATLPGDVSSLPKGLAISAQPTIAVCSGGMTAPSIPSTCCMSGCANCVWLDYAELVVKFYETRGAALNLDDLLGEIDSNVEDEMIKAFIKMEVKSRYMFNK
jgi:hypothetical protein